MFKLVSGTLAAALAAAGTLTLSYPSGTDAGSFTNGIGHRFVTSSGDVFKSPQNFTLSFGTTTITLTWSASGPTIPVNKGFYVQLEMPGTSPQATAEGADPALKSTNGMSLKLLSLGAPITADADGVSVSQSVGAGAAFTITGALATSSIATFDRPRNVVAAWTTTSVLTITGYDDYGNLMVEASASGTSHTGKKAFKTVTRVTSSASITGATVGSGNVLGLPCFMPGYDALMVELENGYNLKPPSQLYIPYEIEATELAAGTAENIVSPVAGYISRVRGVIQEIVTTGGAVTVEINTVAVTGLTFTVANSDAAGTRYSDQPTTLRSATTLLAAGDRITITPAAAFATAGALNGILEIEPLGAVGVIVAGNTTAAQSSTSADVRGTYAPSTVPDGSTRYDLVVRLSDPSFVGFDQYAG